MVINFEARFLFGLTISAANVGEKIEARFGRRLQERTGVGDVLPREDNRRLAKSIDDFTNPFRVLTLQRRH